VGTPRVLIVDDNELNIELARFILEADGFPIATAASAAEAHTRIAEFHPELILMDIQLGKDDGLVLTQEIKAEPATADIIILAFTAFAMKGDEARMRAAGCDGYISKPIELEHFAKQVRAAHRLGSSPSARGPV
jgi:CheY-like chemotaxis protein